MKQISLGVLQYVQDYDESFPLGVNGSEAWPIEIDPYIKSHAVYACPDDPTAGPGTEGQDGRGMRMSYIANGFVYLDWSVGWPPGMNAHGPMPAGGWAGSYTKPFALAAATKPAESIMLSESWDSWNRKQGIDGNFVRGWYHETNVMENIYNEIPDPHRTGTDPKDGCISPHPDGNGLNTNQVANFAFIDGHVKAMVPYLTFKGGWADQSTNMWDATRQ